ncbi:MAG TPA: hypothetical protein VGK22_05965 [Candidatus Angelobacter sp.]
MGSRQHWGKPALWLEDNQESSAESTTQGSYAADKTPAVWGIHGVLSGTV